MYLLNGEDKLQDILIYNNNIYICQSNKITSKHIEDWLNTANYKIEDKIIDSSIENYKLPCIKKLFFTMMFNTNCIPTPEELLNKYLETFFVENKDSTFSIQDFTIKNPKRYNYLGLKNKVNNMYLYLIRYYHLYLMCQESNLFDKVIYSYSKDSDLIIVKDKKYFNINIDIKDSFLNKYRKNKKVKVIEIPNDDKWVTKYNRFYVFNKNITGYIDEKINIQP